MKQSLSRAAVLLTTSALSLAMTATAAVAATTATGAPASPALDSTSIGAPSPATAPHGAPFADPTPNTAHARKVARLLKALARARAVRADAYDAVGTAKPTLLAANQVAHASAAAVEDATGVARQTENALTEARTDLTAALARAEHTSHLLAQNHDAQSAAATAITAAETAHAAANATATALTAALSTLVADRDAAAQQVVDAETAIAALSTTTIPQATTNATTTQMQANTLGTQMNDAFAVYTNQTYAYNGGCFPQSDGLVYCLDNTGVMAVRGEATDMWGTYLTLRAQWEAAQAVADDAAAALTAAQADLNDWNTERTNRIASAATAQDTLSTAQTNLSAAEATQVSTLIEIDTQQTLLDTLIVDVADLTDRAATAANVAQAATEVAALRATTHAAATTVLNDATTTHEAHLSAATHAQQTLNQSYRTLTTTQDAARRIKDRLQKARTHR